MKSSVFLITAALSLTALAHGGIDEYITGDEVYQGWQPYNDPTGQKSIQRQYSSYDPLLIKDLTTVNIRCNNKGLLGTGVTGTVAAGAKLTTHWKQWTHRPATFMVYMAKCPGSCNSWDGSGKVWFKIFEQGLISGTENAGIWAGDAIFETLNATITVPNGLAGEYMFRHELIALHQANNPQFYPECAQFTVTGSGTASPPASYLVSFPGAYTGTEPGLAFDIDSEEAKKATKYPLPGPPLWDGTSSGNATMPGSAAPSTAAMKQRSTGTSGRLRRHRKS
ncbi:glycoside hydrolase family 61 protein [Bipolaris maydis ATCC 48331]|uniref:AA9 family lytic polysaccharide monooxygenase n=2 Tax=Cochliobolus heterostrophus TaxID=5016 RepID=M2U2H7_COCH5|nr:glycoside hydrolase family 61 protein [Bipolaris maydis ATCC 48331]EMD88231.1 glycoside hydrolase family 61 protein [Bipolaris maydis C5]KAH7549162.1 glycoside hydrolase family 61 protein [Bipolaris maydis]ENI02190.1 glycoside hydrolase family 61 protein [Bipolaris maydis ATCC 48331]KAJ5024475.1 glycoside hydrolase [Bipolaris maydis]KAJ5057886.1 glycosyl hydrolase family 61-domain-containing protein [Bipolaris maydis]